MNTLSRLVIAAAMATVGAVGGLGCDSAEDVPTIGGTYRGSATVVDFGSVAYRMVIPTTSGGSFTWSGDFTVNGGPPETVGGPGTYDHPAITLTDDGEALEGTVSDDGDRLTFTDSESGLQLVVAR